MPKGPAPYIHHIVIRDGHGQVTTSGYQVRLRRQRRNGTYEGKSKFYSFRVHGGKPGALRKARRWLKENRGWLGKKP